MSMVKTKPKTMNILHIKDGSSFKLYSNFHVTSKKICNLRKILSLKCEMIKDTDIQMATKRR